MAVVFGAWVNLAPFGIFDRDRPFGDVNRKLGGVHLALVRFNAWALTASAAQRAILATAEVGEKEPRLSLKILDAAKAVAGACALNVVNCFVAVRSCVVDAAVVAKRKTRIPDLLKPIAIIFGFSARNRNRDKVVKVARVDRARTRDATTG